MSSQAALQVHIDRLRAVLTRLSNVRDKNLEEHLVEEARREVAAVREARAALNRAKHP